MTESFDPYLKWLGIPPKQQPPHAYRLLGIELFESDADVISNAADQRMAHLRNFAGGEHSDLSQKILNEIAGARVRLLDAEKKAHYDRALRARLGKQNRPVSQSVVPVKPWADMPVVAAPPATSLPVASPIPVVDVDPEALTSTKATAKSMRPEAIADRGTRSRGK